MASNQISKQVRRTTSVSVAGSSTAWLAAMLVQFAGTAVAIGQGGPASAPAAKAPAPQPETRQLPTEGLNADAKPESKADGKADGDNKIHVDQNQFVDLHVNDEDLANVLEMLSIQSQRNIIASKAVSARVTANLYGVTFFEALDAILNVNGFGYVEKDNFNYIYTQKELDEIVKSQRVKISKVFNLNYLNAIDAAEFVKPLLSEGAQIKTNGKTGAFPSLGETPVSNEEFAGTATLIVYDYEDHVAQIEELIKQLDTRPAQVLVEATILQTTLTQDNALGVDFAIVADMNFQDFVGIGGPLVGPNALNGGRLTPSTTTDALPADGKGSAIASTPGNTAGPGDFKIGVVTKDVSFFLNALDEVTDTTILSNPKLLTLNRQPSRVLVGRKVGYLSSTSTDTATTQTVEFLDTGTQLYFRPFVSSEGMIRMELKPQVSEAVIRQANDSSGHTVTIPDEDTNEVVTNVMVHDGQTIVLGGLFRESTTSTRRQVPLLGDIPLIGFAFRGNTDNTQRNEIIFLITPSIVNDSILSAQGERGKEYIDHVRVGSREGVLFWSRDKLTSKMNVEAERLAESGDTEGALWKAERSLSLNHFQPEVIALRERLTNKKSQWPDRSFLNRVLDGETEPMLKKPGPKASLGDNGPIPWQPPQIADADNSGFPDAAGAHEQHTRQPQQHLQRQ